MGNRELRLSYQEAIQLIRVGRFEEALALLKDIDRERSGVKNVLYPMAVCCEKLGYVEEGIDICDQLIMQYDHEKARAIKARLELSLAYPEAHEVDTSPATDDDVEMMELTPPLAEETPFEVPAQTSEEPLGDTEAIAVAEEQEKPRHRRPTWVVLLIAFFAAAAIAAVIHLFVRPYLGF